MVSFQPDKDDRYLSAAVECRRILNEQQYEATQQWTVLGYYHWYESCFLVFDMRLQIHVINAVRRCVVKCTIVLLKVQATLW